MFTKSKNATPRLALIITAVMGMAEPSSANSPTFINPTKAVGPWVLEKGGRRCRIELTKRMSPLLGRYLLKDPNKCTDRFFGGSKTAWFPSSESIVIGPVDRLTRGYKLTFGGRVKTRGVEQFIGVQMYRPTSFKGPRDISAPYRQSDTSRHSTRSSRP